MKILGVSMVTTLYFVWYLYTPCFTDNKVGVEVKLRLCVIALPIFFLFINQRVKSTKYCTTKNGNFQILSTGINGNFHYPIFTSIGPPVEIAVDMLFHGSQFGKGIVPFQD
ncbi:MAG: hypothetical protein J6X51_07695 [Bacteroidales bacterium]|nr:hypothetical protein [Bacteroidales bacterium]